MPVLCDFIDILENFHTDDFRGDTHVVRLGDFSTFRSEDLGIAFETVGRREDGRAILFCEYRGLTEGEVTVQINGKPIGQLPPIARADEWVTKMISFSGARLRSSGFNSIHIEPKVLDQPTPGNLFDDFQIRELVCFVHHENQSSVSGLE